ncbi:MAG: anti-sigma factor antagonist [Clostridia bacterium]|nr:anti-sigma factor antagonist [Clostridia bacterium]
MQITYEYNGGGLTVYLSGELDHHTAKKTRDAIDDIISMKDVKKLTIDMSGVVFMDSSGIGLVLGRYKLLCELGATLELRVKNAQIRRIFEMSGVNRLIRIR